MTPAMLQMLIPIFGILAVFGFPVALVYVWKYFKLKDRELSVDAELRRTSGQALEQRVQRLESIILALDSDLRAKLTAADAPRQIMEAPASQESGLPDSAREAPTRVR